MEKYAAVILSAGKGTRMTPHSSGQASDQASQIPKVMFLLNGKPIIDHSVKIVRDAGIDKIILTVGYKKELIEEYFGDSVEYAVQEPQLGTGHAVMVAEPLLGGQSDSVLIFYGDCPLYRPETIRRLIEAYEEENPTIALLTAISEDAGVYGRVFRGENSDVTEIIEAKDCTPDQRANKEWNPGFYIIKSDWLWENIKNLDNDNVQKEYYLTDLIQIARDQGERVIAIPVTEESEALGINTMQQLEEAEAVLKNRVKD